MYALTYIRVFDIHIDIYIYTHIYIYIYIDQPVGSAQGHLKRIAIFGLASPGKGPAPGDTR